MKSVHVRAAVAALISALASPFALAQSQSATPVHQLPDSVVSVGRFADASAGVPAGISVLTQEDIKASGAATVNEALMRLLGVAGRQDFYGGGEYSLDLRGFGATADSNQVVIVDGQRLNEGDLDGTRLAGIPIESVHRIEVLRGSAGVLYGEGASAGVIVITTQSGKGIERRNGASVYAGAGSFGLRELRADGTLALGGLSLDLAAQMRKADNHRDNFASSTDALSFGAQWGSESARVGLRFSRDSLDTGLPGSLSAAQFVANPKQTTTPTDRAAIDNQRIALFAEVFWGSWQLAFDLGRRSKELRSESGGFSVFDYDVEAGNASVRARQTQDFSAGKNSLVLGLDHTQWERQVLGLFGSVANQRSTGLYVKDDFTFKASGTRLSAGVRSEKIAKDHSGTASVIDERMSAWELGLSHPLNPAWTAYARAARSFRLANADEFSFTPVGINLRPQTSRDVEAGLRWGLAASKLDARIYRSSLKDEIGFDPTAPGPFGPGANVNFDPTRRQGLELEASHAVSKTLNLRANLAWRQSEFVQGANAGRDVPLVPGRTLALRVDWQPAAAHRLGAGVQWVSAQHPDFANQCRIPAYATTDLRYAYESGALEVSMGVSNLFDRKFYSQAFGCAAGVTGAIYPEPGRAVTLALRLRF